MTAYATTVEADAYFLTRLHSELWFTSSPADKTAALEQATRAIDRLNFAGYKHAVYTVIDGFGCSCNFTSDQMDSIATAAASQELQFPRGSDTVTPSDIKIACYEIAFALIDGVDPDLEYEDRDVVSQGYSSVRVTYKRDTPQDHINSGIPSATAWRYLLPYLRAPGGVRINRV